MLVLGLGEGGMGGFAEELHGVGAERFKGYRPNRISGARMVCVVVSALFSVP
jgi:hypothetical protein